MPKAVWKDVARFRTSSHHLCVETGRWRRPVPAPLSERTCGLCANNVVQDEQHVLLECNCVRLQAIRDKYISIVALCEDDMNGLMQEERSRDLSLFVHECMRGIDSEYHDDMMVDVLEETASSLLG